MIAFLQAFGVLAYCSLIAVVFWQGQNWFGRLPNFLGPFLMLILLSTSALICGLLVFAYPVKLYLSSKNFSSPIRLVILTAAWLAAFSLLIMFGIGFLRT